MNMCIQQLAFMEGLGGMEVLLVMVVILVLFGGDKLPEFARGAGKLIREFKKASSGVEEEFKRALEEDDRQKSIAAPISLTATPAVPVLTPATDTPLPTPAPAMLDPTLPESSAPSASPDAPADPAATAAKAPPAPPPKPASPPKMLPGEGDDLTL